MIHTLVIFHVQAGRAADFESGHRELVGLMGSQPGCIEIRAHRSLHDPLEYMVYGTWEDKQTWERAHQTSRFKELFKGLPLADHTLSKSSFFEPVYGTRSIPAGDHSPCSPAGGSGNTSSSVGRSSSIPPTVTNLLRKFSRAAATR